MSRSSDLGPLPLNWRDVGLSLAMFRKRVTPSAGSSDTTTDAVAGNDSVTLPAGRLLRSGQLCLHHDRDVVGSPKTIINLRHSDDASFSYHPSLTPPGVRECSDIAPNDEDQITLHHAPAENSLEKYDTSDREVARWVASVLRLMQDAEPPILIHCRSGKDRTGVVVCAALLAVGVDPEDIRREYLLSSETDEKHINLALRGLVGRKERQKSSRNGKVFSGGEDAAFDRSQPWLRNVDFALLRNKLMGGLATSQTQAGTKTVINPVKVASSVHAMEKMELCLADKAMAHEQELEYLRKRLQVLKKVAQPLLLGVGVRAAAGLDQMPPSEGHILGAMICVSCRQIELLTSMRTINTKTQKERSQPSKNETERNETELSKKIAQAWARQGYLRKIAGDCVLGRACFERALMESILVGNDQNIPDKRREWEKERAICLEME